MLLGGVGVLIASFAAMIGIGGGLLWAPFFILILKIDPHRAILYSFAIQAVGMGSATVANMRKGLIYWKLALGLLVPIFFGVMLGAFLNQRLANPILLERGLGVLSITVSIYFASRTEYYKIVLNEDRSTRPTRQIRLLSSLFGTVSGVFSIGISDFLIPLFRGKLKIPMQNAIGTTLFLNFSLALIGAVFHTMLSREPVTMDALNVLLPAWAGVVVGGQLGPRLSSIVDDNRLKEIFIFVLIIIGIHLIYQSL